MSQLADALLEAHVQHALAALQRDLMPALVAARVSALFRWSSQVRLDQVVTPAEIMSVIQRYVVELRISGGITELAGELSQRVLSSPHSAATRLDQVLSDDQFAGFADKLVTLDGVRRELLGLIAHSGAFRSLKTRIVARALSHLVFRRAGLRELAARRLERALGEHLERRPRDPDEAEKQLGALFDPEWLRTIVDEIWAALGPKPLAELFSLIDGQDLEDFVVQGHEFWLRYRKSDYFRQITEEAVNHFFAKYGPQSLLDLVSDMGVSEAMVVQELNAFFVPLLERAARDGFLEQQIRASLAPFYNSPAAEAILQSRA